MGTHNRLLGLGDNFYLELIAIDPGAAAGPAALVRARPGGLAGRSPAPDPLGGAQRRHRADAAASTEPPGRDPAMERGDYRWRITVPADGHLPGDGLVPTLIQWDVPFHPARRCPMPAAG
jgi:hypothetical protein